MNLVKSLHALIIVGLFLISGCVSIDPKKLEAEARQGDVQAQYRLALTYLLGSGSLKQDTDKARFWLQEAASQDMADAQTKLGILYYKPETFKLTAPPDYQAAFKWLTKAAYNNDETAQVYLSSMYGMGDGIDKDLAMARAWAIVAGNNGDKNGYKMAAGWQVMMDEDEELIVKSDVIAVELSLKISNP